MVRSSEAPDRAVRPSDESKWTHRQLEWMGIIVNHIACVKSKLGNVEKHGMGKALTPRKARLMERLQELETLATDFGYETRKWIDKKVEEKLK
jgi:hypothetical protein